MQTKEARCNGRPVVYRTVGEGPAVMLVHGFGEDSTVWRRQYQLFPNRKLVLPDLPGSGASAAGADARMETLAQAVYAVVEAEGDETVCLIGHSMGGYLALAFAERWAHRLSGLGLFHSTAFADSEEKKEARRKGIAFMQQHGAEAFLQTSVPTLFSDETKTAEPGVVDEQLARAHTFSAEALVQYYQGMMDRKDRTEIWRQLAVPTLFAMGRHDAAIPLADSWRQCHLPNLSCIHLFPRSGHMGMLEETERTNTMLLDFTVNFV